MAKHLEVRPELPEFNKERLDEIDSQCAVDTVITHTSPSFCKLSSHHFLEEFHMLDIMELREIPPKETVVKKKVLPIIG
jgi:hypothetical protein